MELQSIFNLISLTLLGIYLCLVLYFLRGWKKLKVFKRTTNEFSTSVSIIISARNEAQHIANTLNHILAQDFPKELLEVIVIDDHSEDRTWEILGTYESQGITRWRLQDLPGMKAYKKKAIETAIGLSKGSLIITTDADCVMAKEWLAHIVAYYEAYGYKMISSPVSYYRERNTFEHLQTLEFSYLIGMGAASIGQLKPTTCNGANLCYEKAAFIEVGGFKGIDDLASGDDELLLQKIALKYPYAIGFLLQEKAIVYTYAKENLQEFIQQRKRWASKSMKYKNKNLILLGLAIWSFNLSILLNFILGFVYPELWTVFITQLLMKIAVETLFLAPVMRFFKRKELLWFSPLLSFLHVLYLVYIGIMGNIGTYNWKGRAVK